MFFIKPFRKTPSVRSSLGFMTISSRWAGVLFPGLTVLTRDLVVLQAMHKAYLELKSEKPGFGIKEFAAYKNRNLVESDELATEGDNYILIDHKTYQGIDLENKAVSFSAQLKVYKDSLELTGKKVSKVIVNFINQGNLYEINF
jgi:hypothetical protein